MNLHEECLLKYLINPLDLFYTTELLKQNNNQLQKDFDGNDFFNKTTQINYSMSKI